MRTFPLVVLLAGCGGASSGTMASSGTLTISGHATITASSASVSASANNSDALSDGALPSGLTFTLSGGGRNVTGTLDSLVAALGGKPLDMLTGSELSANQVLGGSGTLAYTGAPVQNLSMTYVVDSYTPAADAFLTLDVSASSAGTSVFGTLDFTHD